MTFGIPQFSYNGLLVFPVFGVLLTLSSIWLFGRLAHHIGLMDFANARKRHGNPVPLVGGLSIYVSMLFIASIFSFAGDFLWLILATSVVVVTGAVDDAIGLGIRLRLVLLSFSAGMMLIEYPLSINTLDLGFIQFPTNNSWMGVALTILAVVGLSNAFNLSDGIDGLASGLALLCLACLALTLFFTTASIKHLHWILALSASIFTFLMVNLSLTPLRKVFLGDAGSLLLGFLLGWTLIFYSQDSVNSFHPMAGLWCTTLPVFDTLAVILNRIRRGRSPFTPDRNHLHYILIDFGLSQRSTLLLILSGTLSINLFGLWFTYAVSEILSFGLYISLFVVFYFVVTVLSNRKAERTQF